MVQYVNCSYSDRSFGLWCALLFHVRWFYQDITDLLELMNNVYLIITCFHELAREYLWYVRLLASCQFFIGTRYGTTPSRSDIYLTFHHFTTLQWLNTRQSQLLLIKPTLIMLVCNIRVIAAVKPTSVSLYLGVYQ